MFTVAEIVEVLGAKSIGPKERQIGEILIDSRKNYIPPKSAFFAIRGKINDGHHYIDELVEKGVKIFIVEEVLQIHEDVSYIVVENVLDALQKLASEHRAKFAYPVVGITGSNAKTIVKEWCYQLLQSHHKIVRSPKSFNSQIGVPLSLLQMKEDNELGIFEAGISVRGEMTKLESMIKPTIGIFTNIGDAHSKGFQNETEKIYEKLKLFTSSATLIYQKHTGKLSDSIELFAEDYPSIELVSWSRELDQYSFLSLKKVEKHQGHSDLHLVHQSKDIKIRIPFSDDPSIENAMHAICLALYVKLPYEKLIEGTSVLHPIEMRLNQKEAINSCTLISDFYNADIRSLHIALDWMDQQQKKGKRTVILSDILQSDLDAAELYKELNTLLKEHKIERLIGIGKEMSEHMDSFAIPERESYLYTSEFIAQFEPSRFQSETILLKGARPYAFEKIEKLLELQTHQTVLEVDLNALGHNLNLIKSYLNPQTKLMAMVKAFGYGSGGHEVAHFLEFSGVDYLTVAYADEGAQLRRAGVKIPIMVMNPDDLSFDTMLEHELEPEIYSKRSLHEFCRLIEHKGIPEAGIHLEINTGMNRLGFDREDFAELIEIVRSNPSIRVKSIFTHLSSSDMLDRDDVSNAQFDEFDRAYAELSEGLGYQPIKHALNSTGIIRFKERQYDMVRLGIALYGVDPSQTISSSLKPVGTLKSIISQIRMVEAGEGIGYGGKGKAYQERRIAIVAIGYADGFNRLLSNGRGEVLVNGHRASIVGNICMDMCMIDVTDIPCQEGDEVIIFGEEPTLTELAEKLHTIPYEILTSVAQRVKRVYSQE